MVASPEIDAVAVVVRVPSHYAPTKAALEAGKHVYCEWPLGRTTEEAVELAELAEARGLKTAVGLAGARRSGADASAELVAAGYVGEILAVKVGLMREGVLTRPSHRTWQRDAALGANTLTIANGHTIDAMRFVTGDFRSLSAVVATQAKQWLDTGTNTWLDVTAPDNILISGWLQNGAVVSSHVAAIPYAGSGYRMEIYGRDGTLVASGEDSPQLSKVLLHGAQRGNNLEPIAGAGALHRRRAGHPDGEPLNVGQMYALFARAIRGGEASLPDFATAVDLHRLVDAIKQASDIRAGGAWSLSESIAVRGRAREAITQRRTAWASLSQSIRSTRVRRAPGYRPPHPVRRRRHLDLRRPRAAPARRSPR